MTEPRRVCVYFSKGRSFGDALSAVRRYYAGARICAMIPAGARLTDVESSLVDEVVITEEAVYSMRHPRKLAHVIWKIRAARYDSFVILFDSPKLRLLAVASGARERAYCALNGRVAAIRPSVAGTVLGVVARSLWGRFAYAIIWLVVRATRVHQKVQ